MPDLIGTGITLQNVGPTGQSSLWISDDSTSMPNCKYPNGSYDCVKGGFSTMSEGNYAIDDVPADVLIPVALSMTYKGYGFPFKDNSMVHMSNVRTCVRLSESSIAQQTGVIDFLTNNQYLFREIFRKEPKKRHALLGVSLNFGKEDWLCRRHKFVTWREPSNVLLQWFPNEEQWKKHKFKATERYQGTGLRTIWDEEFLDSLVDGKDCP